MFNLLSPASWRTRELDFAVSLLSDAGCVRQGNEDSGRYMKPSDPQVLESKGILVVVADGMGGHSAGEVASKMAVETITRIYYRLDEDAQVSLQESFREANRLIHRAALENASLKGMGTTATALVLRGGSAICAHVGDSRLYLVRGDGIYLMTDDHSSVMEMVRQGLLTLEQARHHSDRNVILRALGTRPEVDPSMWSEPLPIRAGDRFLLCSDGLYELVEDEELRTLMNSGDTLAACENLIGLAKARGGYDNITAGIVRVIPREGKEASQAPVTRVVETVK
jgi:serine/threonine protein phosphatase PrpC